jgi:hypothetical protein
VSKKFGFFFFAYEKWTRGSRKNYSPSLLWYDTETIENDAPTILHCCRMCLQNHCLAMIGGYSDRPRLSLWHDIDCTEYKSKYSIACIHCRGNVFTKLLLNNGRDRHKVMGRIYEICHWDGSGARFNDDWFRHSKVDWGDTHTDRHTERGYLISLRLFFFKGKKATNVLSGKYFLSTHDYTKYSPKVISISKRKWSTKVAFKLYVINLVSYHRLAICIERMHVPHHMILYLWTGVCVG